MNTPTVTTYPAAISELTRLLLIAAGVVLPFVANFIVQRIRRFEIWFMLSPLMVLISMAIISTINAPPGLDGYLHQFAIAFAYTPGTYLFFAVGFFFKRLAELKEVPHDDDE